MPSGKCQDKYNNIKNVCVVGEGEEIERVGEKPSHDQGKQLDLSHGGSDGWLSIAIPANCDNR